MTLGQEQRMRCTSVLSLLCLACCSPCSCQDLCSLAEIGSPATRQTKQYTHHGIVRTCRRADDELTMRHRPGPWLLASVPTPTTVVRLPSDQDEPVFLCALGAKEE
jgi:hypothetical protein